MRHLYLAATGQNRGKTTVGLGLLDGFVRRGLSTGFMKPVGQRTVIEDGVPADEDAVLMRSVFGLAEPLAAMSPVHIPRGFTQSLHRRAGRRGPRRADPRRPRGVRRARHPPHRGHRPRRRRRGHRPLERGRRGDARGAGGDRQRGRRRPADRRDRAQRRAVRARTASRSRAPSSTRSTSTPSPGIARTSWSAAWPATASRCWACCRIGRSCRTRRSR